MSDLLVHYLILGWALASLAGVLWMIRKELRR